MPVHGLHSGNLIGKDKNIAERKKYVQYGKDGEFSPFLAVAASFDCGGFGVGFIC